MPGPGWGGPPKGPGRGGPAKAFTADSPALIGGAHLLNHDPVEQAYRTERRAETRDKQRLKQQRTEEIEDRLFHIFMGKAAIDKTQLDAGARLHAIYNGLPVAKNLNVNVDDIAALTDDQLRAELARAGGTQASADAGDAAADDPE